MAVVVNIGSWRLAEPDNQKKHWLGSFLEDSFYKAEMHRAEISRIDHPGKLDDSVINALFIWAVFYTTISAFWLVKYVLN